MTMEDTLKNLFYQGMGVIAITKDKIEKAIDDLVEKGKLSREEGKKFYEEISEDTLKAGHELKEKTRDQIREWIEKSGIPSREEFESLKERIEALEKERATA
jgi:polyhydroxyalkanoate synthesis regulator phasin